MNLDECHFLVTFFHTGFLITPSSLLLTLPLLEERCIPGCRRSTHFHRQSQFTITQLGGGADPPSERPIGSAVSAEQGAGAMRDPAFISRHRSNNGQSFRERPGGHLWADHLMAPVWRRACRFNARGGGSARRPPSSSVASPCMKRLRGHNYIAIIFAGDVYGSTVHTNNEGIKSQIAAPPAAAAGAGRGAVEGGGAAAAGQLPARRLTHAERLGNAKASMLKLFCR